MKRRKICLKISKSLERRTERLKKILHEKNVYVEFVADILNDEFPGVELETKEDELGERATAAQTILELSKEIQTLERLD